MKTVLALLLATLGTSFLPKRLEKIKIKQQEKAEIVELFENKSQTVLLFKPKNPKIQARL